MDSSRSANRIASRVREGRAGLTRELTAAGTLRIVTVLLSSFAAGVLLHLLLRVGSAPAWGVSLALLAGVVIAVVRFLTLPLSARPREERFVEWLDERHDANKNIIVSAYQLGRDESSRTRFAPDLVDAIVDRGAAAAERVDLHNWRNRSGDRSWWYALGAAAAGLVIMTALAGPPRVGRAFGKVLNPALAALPPVQIDVLPGDLTVEKGADVAIKIHVSGSDRAPVLRVRETGGIWMNRRLQGEGGAAVDPGVPVEYTEAIRKVERDHEYQVVVDKSETPVWRISVNEPPRIVGFEITYFYPDYTGRPSETVTGGSGDMAALTGSKIRMKVLTNRKMAAAWMQSGPAGSETLDQADALDGVDDANWETRFTLDGDAREYMIALKDESGAVRSESPRFRMEAVADRTPSVRLIFPDRDMPIPEEMNVGMAAEGLDDFGLTRLDLVYSIKDGADGRIRIRDFRSGTTEMEETFQWDLVPLNLFPGNEVTYHLELFDNDRISGPKAGKSEVRHLRFPTMDEIYAEIQDEHKGQIDDLSSLLNSSKEMKEQLDKLSRESKRGDKMDWEKKKEIENLLEKQASLEKNLSDAARQLEETLNKAQEQTLISPELLQKMQELNDLVQSIKNEKLQESLQRLNEAMQKMDPDAIDKALEDFKLDQEQMVKSLDQTIEMLKEIRKEEMMEDMVRKAQDLADEQRDLSKEIEKKSDEKDGDRKSDEKSDKGDKSDRKDGEKADKTDAQKDKDGDKSDKAEKSDEDAKSDKNSKGENKDGEKGDKELAEKQQDLQKKAEDLDKQLEELKKLADNEPKLQEELDKIDKSQEKKSMQDNMEQSESELSQGSKDKALNFAFKAAEDAQSMAQSMKKAQSESNAAKKREMQEKLLGVIQDLVDVSSAQEDLIVQAPTTREGELAARQRVLMDGALKAALELEALGKRTLFVKQEQTSKLGAAMNRMSNATKNYAAGNRNNGLREGIESAGDLNEAIVELMQSHSSMCNSGSATGFMESMEKMAGLSEQQQDLNNQAQSMGGGKSGTQKRLSRGEGESLEAMAAQQEAIRRGLEDVAGKMGDRKDVLGRLDDLAKEMGEVAREMKNHNLDERVLERQQKILNRLLDAQKSIRKKEDKNNERESRTGEQLARSSPGPLTREQLMGPERLRNDILRGQADSYPPQYRGLVEKYFRALSEKKADGDGSGKKD